MGVSVNFWGKDAVLKAYEYTGIPNWAIFCQRNLLTSYKAESIDDGAQALDQFFDMLKESQSDGIYQLRMYEGTDRITQKSEYHASFTFKLTDQPDQANAYQNTFNGISSRLQKIEERLSGASDEEEDEVPVWQQAIAGIVQKPEFQNFIMGKVFAIAERFFGPHPATSVGAVPPAAAPQPGEELPSTAELYNRLHPEERAKMDAALQILMAGDPVIGTNLLKLAQLLQSSPKRYQMAATMI